MSDKYYTSFMDYFKDANPKPRPTFGKHTPYKEWLSRRRIENQEYKKQMELQKTELDTLRSGQPKTVNYGTAISVDDITKSGIEADDERARAAALEQLEKERLGANIVSMGQTSLLRGLK